LTFQALVGWDQPYSASLLTAKNRIVTHGEEKERETGLQDEKNLQKHLAFRRRCVKTMKMHSSCDPQILSLQTHHSTYLEH
jgi:ABC-type dipeptide/oligopeptide/nickel transport system ATPase component